MHRTFQFTIFQKNQLSRTHVIAGHTDGVCMRVSMSLIAQFREDTQNSCLPNDSGRICSPTTTGDIACVANDNTAPNHNPHQKVVW